MTNRSPVVQRRRVRGRVVRGHRVRLDRRRVGGRVRPDHGGVDGGGSGVRLDQRLLGDDRVEAVVRVRGVVHRPPGAVRVHEAVRSVHHVAVPALVLALGVAGQLVVHVVRVRVRRVRVVVRVVRLHRVLDVRRRGRVVQGGGRDGVRGGRVHRRAARDVQQRDGGDDGQRCEELKRHRRERLGREDDVGYEDGRRQRGRRVTVGRQYRRYAVGDLAVSDSGISLRDTEVPRF